MSSLSTLFPYTTLFRSRMDDPPPKACEVCGAAPLERVFHPVPVFFKGSGFYSTDYGRRKRKVESGGEGEGGDRKSTRLNSSHANISYAVFCLKKKNMAT